MATSAGLFDPSEVAKTLKECLKMKKFDHPHVMGILGICLAGQTPYIVMPFMANGSLHSYLRKYRPQLLTSEDGDTDHVSQSNNNYIIIVHPFTVEYNQVPRNELEYS